MANQGIVDRTIEPGRLWRVKYQGSFWFARPYGSDTQITVQPGELVKIMGRSGITLLVTPEVCGSYV